MPWWSCQKPATPPGKVVTSEFQEKWVHQCATDWWGWDWGPQPSRSWTGGKLEGAGMYGCPCSCIQVGNVCIDMVQCFCWQSGAPGFQFSVVAWPLMASGCCNKGLPMQRTTLPESQSKEVSCLGGNPIFPKVMVVEVPVMTGKSTRSSWGAMPQVECRWARSQAYSKMVL